MKTIEMNTENWTGTKEAVKLYADGVTFQVYDEKFRLVVKSHDKLFADDGTEIFPAYRSYKIQHMDSGEWCDTDWKGSDDVDCLTGELRCFTFMNWTGEIVRRHKDDPRLAAALLVFMTY